MNEKAQSGEAASGRDGDAVVEVRNLDTHYGARKILNDVSFEVRKGEIFIILGGSGSGKSTLLRHIIGLLHPSSGSIRMFGKETVGMGEDTR